jgi:hypothetical protein
MSPAGISRVVISVFLPQALGVRIPVCGFETDDEEDFCTINIRPDNPGSSQTQLDEHTDRVGAALTVAAVRFKDQKPCAVSYVDH